MTHREEGNNPTSQPGRGLVTQPPLHQVAKKRLCDRWHFEGKSTGRQLIWKQMQLSDPSPKNPQSEVLSDNVLSGKTFASGTHFFLFTWTIESNLVKREIRQISLHRKSHSLFLFPFIYLFFIPASANSSVSQCYTNYQQLKSSTPKSSWSCY